jgi:hypothetical protein
MRAESVVTRTMVQPGHPGLEEQELAWFKGFRWWRLDELASSSEQTSPDTPPSVLIQVASMW